MPTEFELKLNQLRNCMVVVAFHEIVAAHNADIAALEAERDALRADRRALAIKVGHEITSWIDANDPMPDVERIVDAIAARSST